MFLLSTICGTRQEQGEAENFPQFFYSLLNYLRRRGFDVSENKFTKQMSTVHSAQLKFLQLKFLLFTINEMINKREESISEYKDGMSVTSAR